jgi:hypothetical protein
LKISQKEKVGYLHSKTVVYWTTRVRSCLISFIQCPPTPYLAEDELQNVEMAEEELRQKNQDLKAKKRDYTGYDDDEFAAGNEGMKRAVLAKYDDDLEGATETVSIASMMDFSAAHLSL